MIVELLYFDGCPAHERVAPTLRRLADHAGADLRQRRIETTEDADAQRFLGSPTVRVDGTDIEPGAEKRTDFGLKCRLYRTADGLSGLPPDAWIRAALAPSASASAEAEEAAGTAELPAAPLAGVLVGADRWAANRIAGLDPAGRRLYASILRGFVDGRSPTPIDLEGVAASDATLQALVERDLIQLGEQREINVAYPFSAQPTRHRVTVRDGRSYWAMCAIDALGIPYFAHQPTRIDSREPDSDRSVAVTIDPDADDPRWQPREAVVVAASSGVGCSSECACPHINLFASSAAAERYLAAPELRGIMLTIPQAVDAGRQLFGGLLDRLSCSDGT